MDELNHARPRKDGGKSGCKKSRAISDAPDQAQPFNGNGNLGCRRSSAGGDVSRHAVPNAIDDVSARPNNRRSKKKPGIVRSGVAAVAPSRARL